MRLLLAWILWVGAAIEAGLIGTALIFFPALGAELAPADSASLAVFLGAIAVVALSFASAGLLVVRHAPSHPVGWVMLVGGPGLATVFVGYLFSVSLVGQRDGPAAWWGLLGTVLFTPAIFLVGPSLAMVFPGGSFLPGRWRAVFMVLAGLVAASALLLLIAPGPLEKDLPLRNPLGVNWVPPELRDLATGLSSLALSVGGLIAIASLIVRYRGADAEVRHQLKWFLFAVAIWVAVLPISLIGDDNWLAVIALIGLALVPVAVLIAITRFRLYEIDTLINRTLVYLPLVGIVAGLYAGCVALLQRLFISITGDTSDAVGVISALVLAAFFTPIRNGLQGAVDKRFKPEAQATADPTLTTPEFEAAVERIVRKVITAKGSPKGKL